MEFRIHQAGHFQFDILGENNESENLSPVGSTQKKAFSLWTEQSTKRGTDRHPFVSVSLSATTVPSQLSHQ
jgi:hypothetical protein